MADSDDSPEAKKHKTVTSSGQSSSTSGHSESYQITGDHNTVHHHHYYREQAGDTGAEEPGAPQTSTQTSSGEASVPDSPADKAPSCTSTADTQRPLAEPTAATKQPSPPPDAPCATGEQTAIAQRGEQPADSRSITVPDAAPEPGVVSRADTQPPADLKSITQERTQLRQFPGPEPGDITTERIHTKVTVTDEYKEIVIDRLTVTTHPHANSDQVGRILEHGSFPDDDA